MRKILLCLEDYNELLFVETLLKKVGFNVDSVRNEFSLSEKLLEVLPDLVIATGDGLKVSGQRVSKKVKRKGLHAKLLLLFPREKLLGDDLLEGMAADAAIETPLNPRRLLVSICQLTGIEPETVIAKFNKLPIAKDSHEAVSEMHVVQGAPESTSQTAPPGKPSAAPSGAREAKYAEFLKNVPPSSQATFPKKIVQNELDAIRKYEKDENLSPLEEERKNFVTSLFKKK